METNKVGLAAGADAERLVNSVRERYGRIAKGEVSGCCGPSTTSCCGSAEKDVSLGIGYAPEDLAKAPEEANLGLGCGAPLAVLDPKPGEVVLDLGSGAGLDAFLAAAKVGPGGRVIGVDMTPEMLERARRAAKTRGLANVEFRAGRLEELPVASGSVDAVTSNCVINLVPDKGKVFAEIARVLRPGGRVVISDIILDAPLPPAVERDVYAYVGCVSGAALRETYFTLVSAAGLARVEVVKDVDYLAGLAKAAPEEAEALSQRTGVPLSEVLGKVRSVTFRAYRP